MCSTAAQRIAEIGQAIDDLAVKAAPTAQAGPAAGDTEVGDTDPIVARLAELWALLAELDPEVGRRLAGYQSLSALTDLWRTRIWPPDRRPGPALPAANRAVPAATLRRDGPPTSPTT